MDRIWLKSYPAGVPADIDPKKFRSLIELFDSSITTIPPGQTIELTVAIPDCAAQIDLFYGPLLLSLDGQRYDERLLDSHFAGGTDFCPPGTPAPTRTRPSSTRAPTCRS